MSTAQLDYFAPCPIGLENVLVGELETLGAERIRARPGGVAFCGSLQLGYAVNLWSRTAIRVQHRLHSGRAASERELYALVQEIDWLELLTVDHTLAVDASVRDSAVTHSKYAALKTKDAIVDQLRDRTGSRPNVDVTAPDLPVKVTLLRNVATIYRNLSGDSLHRRGWRPIQVKSPLNETLAAALLLSTGWDARSPLVDPMCGSATLLIEAAHLALDRAPGLLRMFAFETWPDFDANGWEAMRERAARRARTALPFPIEGADRHRGALALARKAAAAAGVADVVRLVEADAAEFVPSQPPAQVVVNPPYGQRIGEGDDLRASWSALGQFLHRCRGATAHVLCGDPELTRHLGLRASDKLAVRNGGIECRWLRYEIREE
ncbi:MAG: RNA methyltransferase [Planctomycetes bacterium]|nr:RNA methyltransferase [Planctomycetota bacterium]MCB9888860.1 RNA methyltransferase [Planctomycetota bacterium]